MLAVFGPVRQASADILQATFTGTYAGAGGFFFLNGQLVPYASIVGDPYTATFLFNSDRGTLSSPSPGVEQLSGSGPTSPSLGAVVVIDGGALGRIVGGSPRGSERSFLSWQTDGLDDLNIIQAFAQSGGGFNDVDIGPVGEFPPFAKCAPGSMCGFFQSGPCPGAPCGFLNVSSATL